MDPQKDGLYSSGKSYWNGWHLGVPAFMETRQTPGAAAVQFHHMFLCQASTLVVRKQVDLRRSPPVPSKKHEMG